MNASHLYGAIDIGSNAVKVKIVQWKAEKLTTLEEISRGLELGDEVFAQRVISRETLEELIDILSYYARLFDEYEVEKRMCVATAALREAANRALILETIRRKTGLEVQIIEDAVEKFLTYKSMRDRFEDFDRFREEGTVFVELTSSSCDITFYRNNKMIRNDEIGIGLLSLKESLSRFSRDTSSDMEALESYIHTKVDYMSNVLKKRHTNNYMAMGAQLNALKDTFFGGSDRISAKEYRSLHQQLLQEKTFFTETCLEAGLDWQEVLVTYLFFKVFLDVLRVGEISIPHLSLRDGLIAQMIDESLSEADLYKVFNEDPFSTSYQTAKRFGVHTAHARHMQTTSLRIFEALKKDFTLSSEDRIVLRHTALLHEIGKSVDLRNYLFASASMIRGMRIFSLSNRQVERVAHLCDLMGLIAAGNQLVLSEAQEDLRLSTILTLCDALDASKDQTMRVQDVQLRGDILYLFVKSSQMTPFVEDSLQGAKEIFHNVFGLSYQLERI